MRAYLLALSVLSFIVFATAGLCRTRMILQNFEVLQEAITCPCKETSTDCQRSCDCFEIPKINLFNLTCYEGVFANVTTSNLKDFPYKFVNRTFPNLVKSCKHPCQHRGEMIKVNGTVFWERMKTIFQNIEARKE